MCDRNITIKQDNMCNRNISVEEHNNYKCWENKKTTRDEVEQINYFMKYPELMHGKYILHVGVGNSEFSRTFFQKTTIDGITVSLPEKENAYGYKHIHIVNKYNINDMDKNIKDRKYDLIFDNAIKSFTCCEHHFHELFAYYIDILKPDGVIVTSKYGMDWSGYDFQTKLSAGAFSNSTDHTNPDKSKIFSLTELTNLCDQHGLNLDCIENTQIILLSHRKK